MRLLFVVNDIDFFISHRLPIAEFALKNNYKVFVASNELPNINLNGVEFLKFDIDRSSVGLISNFNSLVHLKKIFKSVSPDIVHSITLKSIVLSNLCLIFNRKIKVINAISGLGYLFTSNRRTFSKQILFLLLRIILFKKHAHYIFQNEKDLLLFKQLGLNSNYTLIKGSGVDAKKFLYTPSIEKDSVNILCTARMLKDKGIMELIEASKILAKKCKHFKLILLGKIDLENPAHITKGELINAIDIPQIKWLGHSDEINDALKKCHIYCLPSYREGLPKSIVEAMAIGRPIVTTTAPGCEDCVIEGVNGFKVPIKDASALAEKLEVLMDDSALRLKMGKASREFFEKEFTLDKVVKKHMEIFNHMLTI